MRLEYDILNKDGFGLKRGFYEIRPDSDYTYLMFIQSGKIKAKIPVIKMKEFQNMAMIMNGLIRKKPEKTLQIQILQRITEENTVVSPEKNYPQINR